MSKSLLRTRAPVATLTAVLLVFARSAPAQTTWHVEAIAPPGGDGSVGAPFQTLAGAFAAAASGDVILIAAGAYFGPDNRDLDTAGRSLTLAGSGSQVTTIFGGGSAADPHRVLRISGGGTVCTVQGIGFANTFVGGAVGAAGGGLLIEPGATAHVAYCTFDSCLSDNQWPSRGAGVYVGSGASADFGYCDFTGCLAAEGAGAFVESNATASFVQCAFTNNAALTGGAAIWCAQGPGSTSISDCSFFGNASFDGGAVATGMATGVYGSLFLGNSGGFGGAILAHSSNVALQISATTFSSNTASVDGGAVFVHYEASATVSTCTFWGNQAGSRGGALAVNGGGAVRTVAHVVDCDFLNNTAVGWGGGVSIGYGADLHAADCLMNGNTAASGGGLSLSGASDSTATNVDIAANSANDGGGIFAVQDGGVAPNFAMAGGSLSENAAVGAGGGLFASGGGQFHFVGTTIADNDAFGGSGGGARLEWGAAGRFEALTLSGNSAVVGGALMCSIGAVADLVACDVVGNSATARIGGVGADDVSTRSPTLSLERTTFAGNSAPLEGAVRVGFGATAVAKSCLVYGNTSPCGPAFTAIDAGLELRHCTVVDNLGSCAGAAVRTENASTVLVANSILRGGTGPQIDAPSPATALVVGSDVEGGAPGLGNFDADPLFANAAGGDYRPTPASPCRNGGQNALSSVADLDRAGGPRLMEGIADVGAYERPPLMAGTAEDVALASYVTGSPPGATGHSAPAGALLSLGLTSPGGTFYGALPVIVATLYTAAAPPPFSSFLPYLHVDLGNLVFLVDGSAPPPFYVQALGPNGAWFTAAVPPGLSGLVLRVQGAVASPVAVNGAFAATDAHEVAFR